ncbi:ABC transporter ATP-binding protein [Tindallia californiensis]|uniref:ATP-binding cassette, subfamily F, member 3 n=1 Tax=Tindallia californiensis TaxID=159292 RepID=A0A1H3L8Q7_9FIRM|nr:ATP-binding cassette domain-containing protein [Tindallia californiensis]SDY60265.1 ATP-binding cassette, subfamily F, member 3 [Tindallia californiensis]
MIILSVNQLVKSFGTDLILDQVSFSIQQKEKVGLVGANGAGKSTLFQMIAGEIPFDSGNIHIPNHIQLGRQDQLLHFKPEETVFDHLISIFTPLIQMESQLREMEATMSNLGTDPHKSRELELLMQEYSLLTEDFEAQNGYGFRSEVRGVLNGLGFYGDDFYQKASLLSGGQKTRLALARLLLSKPNLILLDEPTNHLDIDSVQWLEGFLKTHPSSLLIISHDRYFLDQVTDRTLELDQTHLMDFTGSYSLALKKKAALLESMERRRTRQMKEVRQQEDLVRKLKQHGTEKLAKRAASREKKLSKMEVESKKHATPVLSSLQFQIQRSSGRHVLTAEEVSKQWPGHSPLFQDISFTLERGDRMALVGPNGIGKTTLFRIAMNLTEATRGTIQFGHQVKPAYYHQELTQLNEKLTVLEEMQESFPQQKDSFLRTCLGSLLFFGDDVFKPIHLLSGGEKARLSLLKIMLSPHNLLLLDEPTNHLDIPARENLEVALNQYDGTIFFISHDRYFMNQIATKILELTPSGATTYLGNYDQYLRKKKQLELEEDLLPSPAITKTQSKQEKKKERERRMQAKSHQKALDQLEQDLETVEAAIVETEEAMCLPEVFQNPEKSKKLHQKRQELEATRDSLYKEWESLLD